MHFIWSEKAVAPIKFTIKWCGPCSLDKFIICTLVFTCSASSLWQFVGSHGIPLRKMAHHFLSSSLHASSIAVYFFRTSVASFLSLFLSFTSIFPFISNVHMYSDLQRICPFTQLIAMHKCKVDLSTNRVWKEIITLWIWLQRVLLGRESGCADAYSCSFPQRHKKYLLRMAWYLQ